MTKLKTTLTNEDLDVIWNFFKENDHKGNYVDYGLEDFMESIGIDYYATFDKIKHRFIEEGLIIQTPSGFDLTTKQFSGFVTQDKEQKEQKRISDGLQKYNYDTRKLPIWISIASLIIASMFSLYTCVNESSNKSEIQSIKDELKSIKDTISTYSHTKKGD